MDYLRDDPNSSRFSQESDVLEMKSSPPRSINPPDTSSSTSTATGLATVPVQPMIEDTNKSKWKPLVGTPSKEPIPENILVPDPSTPQTVSDTDSLAALTPSTPTSFILNRRRGEHTSRPPAYPLPVTPTRAATLPLRKIDCDTKDLPYTPALSDGKAPDVDNDGTGSPRPERPPRPFASQIPAFSDIARESPEYHRALDQFAKEWSQNHITVNTMRSPDPLAHFHGGLKQGQTHSENEAPTDFATASSVEGQPGPSGSSVIDTPGPCQPGNTWRGVGNVQKRSQPSHRVAEEPPQTPHTEQISTSKPTRANSTQSADHHQRGSETSGCESDHGESSSNPLVGCVSNVSATGARPYAHIENPVLIGPDAAAELDVYLDLRCKPYGPGTPDWDKRIKVGSQIVFIGSTRWSNEKGEGVYDVGIPYGTQCYVARIFNDYWALCLKLERGLEPYCGDQTSRLFDRLRRPRGPKIVEHGGKPCIALKNHPVVAIYAPLCAFTISANYGPFEERREAVGNRTTGLSTWEGGIIQAANRGASSLFEDEAKRAWKMYVPLQVWVQYLEFCRHSQQTTDDLGKIVTSENAPSGWARVDQDFSSHKKEKSTTGRQFRSIMSKRGTVKAVKNTANRVKSVFKPEPGAVNVPSDRIDASRGAAHPVYGDTSGLAPERSNVIPPIAPQSPLRPFDDGQLSQIERPLLDISPNVLSNPDLPLLETLDNGDDAQQSTDHGNNQSEVANPVLPSLGESLSGGPIQFDPHPGVKVTALGGLHPGIDFVRVGTSPGTSEYRIVPAVEPPERQGDQVIVPVYNPPENPDVGEVYMQTRPAAANLPFRLKKAIQGKVGKVSSERGVPRLATLFRRRFAARVRTSQPQEGRVRRRGVVQNSIANALNSIQPVLRRRLTTPRAVTSQAITREAITPRAMTLQARTPEATKPQERRHRRHNTVQNVISDAWNSMRSSRRRRHPTMPQATESHGTVSEPLVSEDESTHHGADRFNHQETSGAGNDMNRSRFSLPIERLRDFSIRSPPRPRNPVPNPRPQPQIQPLPIPGGLSEHLRNVAPYSGVGRRLRHRLSI